MKTLMRNGRDRRSENPLLGHAKKERVVLIGTDQRITSGPAAKRLHSKAEYMTAPERFAEKSDSSCTAGAVHTWRAWHGRCWPMAAPIGRLSLRQRRKRSGDGRMRLRPCV